MIATIDWRGRTLRVDYAAGRALAIPLDFHGPQPAFFTARRARARALQEEGFTGDVRQGGSCNAEVLEFVPHCHGTHTECIGHLRPGGGAVQDLIFPGPVLARLVTLEAPPADAPGCSGPTLGQAGLQRALQDAGPADWEALVVRTRPAQAGAPYVDYARAEPYPVFSADAMRWLAARPLRHLLLDTPSLDRADDPQLSLHRVWWGLATGAPEPAVDPARRSITEMVHVPTDLPDGDYWLHLELSPLRSDATPSRPMLYPLVEASA
ncbi:MAG: hypothetical protein GTN86_08785 [Xanthomonadales bacterium]|uniref:cyclase family protein n=1 Tax=Hydrogenophaga sp. TaxID=1904254 RepID=UPI0016969D9F|nr:cyclase family protein [Hydrogenophaga sp.]NIM70688.1 hypothetical protein [Xanthomonadales bacterium]NIN33443.1 hypothetical protein [Hydrogenophaga sp.]NIN59965.1 hypothetical protein [Xanthomonadales bacterium]NIN75338.1 hypothetical protein [Xanthomonadales bacterium]NIO13507.1 hypothetical protein [Xanthomonadales bacterium]